MNSLRLILLVVLALTAPTIGQATDIASNNGQAVGTQGIAQANSSRETPTCRAFYDATKKMDLRSCTHVSIAISWTSATFELPKQCNTWKKFIESGSKSASNYGKCRELCPERAFTKAASAFRQPPNCPPRAQ
jgi:hypothetical protein